MSAQTTFEGVFEAHVTVGLPIDERRFCDDCIELGVKPIVIKLPLGASPLQPMTSAIYEGDLDLALTRIRELAKELELRGYVPNRLKLEAGPDNLDIPDTDEAASLLSNHYYFEHHLKTRIEDEQEYTKLRNLCADHDAHASSNAINQSPDGVREVFVTVRSYAVGRKAAEKRIDALVEALRQADITVLKRIIEYCVYDSNVSLDDGWQ